MLLRGCIWEVELNEFHNLVSDSCILSEDSS